jgi:hypothetical protein
MTNKIIISGILSSDFPITAEQLSKTEELSSHLGLSSVLTFSENLNRTIDIEVFYVCSESVDSDWFRKFSRQIATIGYLGEKYDLRLNGLINVSDGYYGHPVGEIDIEGGTMKHSVLDYDEYVLAGHREMLIPFILPELG